MNMDTFLISILYSIVISSNKDYTITGFYTSMVPKVLFQK